MFWIFGDSYAQYDEDDNNPEGSTGDDKCWQNLVKQHEELSSGKALTRGGQSIYSSLRLLQQVKPTDKVIFFLTDSIRIPFPFLERPEHTNAAYEMYEIHKSRDVLGFDLDSWCVNKAEESIQGGTDEKGPKGDAMGYSRGGNIYNNIEKVVGVYNTFEPEIKIWSFYACLFLKWYQENNDVNKMLVVTTEKNIFEHVPFDWTTLNTDKFKIIDTQLREVCGNEFHDGIIRQEIEQHRKNHLSYPNHITLYNIISNFFYGTSYPEDFHENLYNIKDGQEIDEFIYE